MGIVRELVDDRRLPAGIREQLAGDYAAVRAMLDKLEHGHIHIAVFGRVSVGKSALVNALLGEERFTTSPLHGMTRQVATGNWRPSEVTMGASPSSWDTASPSTTRSRFEKAPGTRSTDEAPSATARSAERSAPAL